MIIGTGFMSLGDGLPVVLDPSGRHGLHFIDGQTKLNCMVMLFCGHVA